MKFRNHTCPASQIKGRCREPRVRGKSTPDSTWVASGRKEGLRLGLFLNGLGLSCSGITCASLRCPASPRGHLGNGKAAERSNREPCSWHHTWKQEGHMVIEASGRSERKYCHCRGGGQRLMRTSRRLMERRTDRLTTTGTNSEPPCYRVGRWEAGAPVPLLNHGDTFTWVMIPECLGVVREASRDFPCQVPRQSPARSGSPCWPALVTENSPPPLPQWS